MKLRQTIFRPWRFLPFELPAYLKALVFAGVGGYPVKDRRFLAVANMTGYLGTLSSLSFALTFAFVDFNALRAAVIGNLVSAAGSALTPFTHRFGRCAAVIYLAFVFYSTLFFFVSQLGRDAGIQLNYIAAAAIAITICGAKKPKLATALAGLGLALHLAAWFAFPTGLAEAAITPSLMSAIYIQSAGTIMIILGAVTFYILRLSEAAEEKSDALLSNMMPAMVAERLKEKPDTIIADFHPAATVMFADLTGFTRLAAELGPEKTVALLDELFSRFDLLAARRGVEKIKTIGDAYLVVAGAPAARADHAETIMGLAIEMRRELDFISVDLGQDLQIRIGIESGPLIAGVIGRAKFAYDVWGDTVNMAARLQQLAAPGEILAGGGCNDALGGHRSFRYLGSKAVQGVGEKPVWALSQDAQKALAH
ncbi:adenylate/guanylate cyclase domain-containing protein [Hyphococcus sp.]|uniref:adenylate/guanylate cyclase domain-containing protein n=1 Tax=Hyphococcus sp. TaxID=2038636 RepID=UPI0035C7867F